jgi:hypothetical protein
MDAQNMDEPKFEASVGMSRKWDAREAGREVAKKTIEKLSNPPDFFLLFSTIHYEKHGGFQEFLNGVWDVLPKGTSLIGGTVPGFMNNYGCYTRGATALAVSYPNMDVVLGVGKNTKRNPKKAAEQSAEMIERGFIKSRYKNRFILNFISGPETWKIPGQGYKKIVDSGFWSRFAILAYGISQYLLQKGSGREDEIFEEMVKKFPKYYMLLGASMDDYRGISNYQFFGNKILTNSVVNLGLATDLDLNVCTTHGMKRTNIKFEITKLSKDKHIIKEINKKPPVPELLRLLNWPEGFLNEKTMYSIIPYYPISFKRHGKEVPTIMPGFLKDSIVTPSIIDLGEVSILTLNGKDLIYAAKEGLQFFEKMNIEFGLFSTCVTILTTLGYKINIIRNEIVENLKGKPFLMFFSAGEGTYSPEKNLTYANISFNTALFGNCKR